MSDFVFAMILTLCLSARAAKQGISPMRRLNPWQMTVLHWLTWKVRVIADSQLLVAGPTTGITSQAIARQLKTMANRGWIQRRRLATFVPVIESPLACWQPDDHKPPLAQVTWQLERRWSTIRPAPHWISWATERATTLMGGVGGTLRQPLQLQHDLGSAAVFLRRRQMPTIEGTWLSEDVFRQFLSSRRFAKIPDGVIVSDRKEVVCAIEFGGRYDVERLEQFHRYWSQRQVPYEIW